MARAASANFRAGERRAIAARDQTCQIQKLIGKPCVKAAVDDVWNWHHVKPVAEGGEEHDIANGVLLHDACHRSYYRELHGDKWVGARYMKSSKARKYWLYRDKSARRLGTDASEAEGKA